MFEATARLKIRDGELDGFKQQAAEVMSQAKAKDTKTLRYDWFISDDGTQCEVLEGYVDADGLLEHSDHVGEVRAKLFSDFAYDHDMTLYAEPSPALAGALEAMGTKFTRFSFFQGLEADVEVLDDAATMFEVTARLKVRDGELEGFEHQAAELIRLTRERDTKTLRYDWFLSDDGTRCEVREGYVDADGLLEHHLNIAEAKAELFRDFADDHHMTFYSEPSPALAEAMEGMAGHVEVTQFSFFQGLAAEAKVLEEVPA
jgi:quinol monooxygenase YgiN